MISDDGLRLAVERGLLTPDQVAGLRELEQERASAGAEPQDPEAFRFITGFADVFVTIGIALFLGAVAWFVQRLDSETLTAAVVAGLAWALAEFFTRRRRMALPSIVLLVVWTAAVFVTLATILGGLIEGANAEPADVAGPLAAAALGAAAGAAAHFWRFRVPITVAAGYAALAGAALGSLAAIAPEFVEQARNFLLLVCGLGAFALAMRFDLADRQRTTRRTDMAFWLHLLAAPLIVHPLVLVVFGPEQAREGVAPAVGLLALFAFLAVVALLVDRRALLVSGLAYAGWALSNLLRGSGIQDETVPATLLVLGALVLLLSAGWRPIRAAVLSRSPAALANRLPPAHVTSLAGA